jgi:hypothetical protein
MQAGKEGRREFKRSKDERQEKGILREEECWIGRNNQRKGKS